MAWRDIIRKLRSKKSPPAEGTGKDAPAELVPPQDPWAGDMLPRAVGPGKRIEYSGGGSGSLSCGSTRLEWVSRETDREGGPVRVRTPEERTVTVPEVGFMAGGKLYASRSQLTAEREKNGPWARDVYGRYVLVIEERFPCFDSADFLYEKRYFRWYFLCQEGKLTRVYHTDETPTVTVTKDVLDLETQCWEKMQKWGCFL